jgi:glycogen operon protein
MITMGDEVRRTQGGNNNAYCQDNETSWFDWSLVTKNADIHRFVRLLLARRILRDIEWERRRIPLRQMLAEAKLTWHGVRLYQPDWSWSSHSLAFHAQLRRERLNIHFLWNAYWEALDFELPPVRTCGWHRWIDTALEPPHDIVDWRTPTPVSGLTYRVEPRSTVVLLSPPGGRSGLPGARHRRHGRNQ